jgi:hypothetical protein
MIEENIINIRFMGVKSLEQRFQNRQIGDDPEDNANDKLLSKLVMPELPGTQVSRVNQVVKLQERTVWFVLG